MDVSSRLLRMLKAATNDKVELIGQIIEQGSTFVDDILKEWEIKHGIYEDISEDKKDFNQTGSTHYKSTSDNGQSDGKSSYTANTAGYSSQTIDDLKLFDLRPPITLEEVKKARNREIKKFHPDKFLNQPDKLETAKRILQIYNAAYDRLEHSLK